MWRRLELRNFKSLRDVSLELEPLTVLVGDNGAGKTSVLDGARILADLTVPPAGGHPWAVLPERFGTERALSPSRLRTRGVADDEWLELGALVQPGAFNQPQDHWKLGLRAAASTDADQSPWITVFHNGSGGPLTHQPQTNELAKGAARELARLGHGPAMKLALNAGALARPSYLEHETPRLRPDGFGLPSLLAAMAATNRDSVDELERSLRAVIPRAKRIRTPPVRVKRSETQIISVDGKEHAIETPREQMGHRLELDMEGAGWLDASLLSEGTLIALTILALLHSESCPKLVLIDDLDHSLHPTAYGALVRALRDIRGKRPELQLVCTTHAPYLLDNFTPEEVRVLRLDQRGHTHVRKLVDHPEWSEQLRGLSTGEFWSSVGEEWVAAANEE